MFSRKGHIPGWANDMTVMNAYMRNLTNAYYRQVNQIMSRNVMNEAWKGQSKKFGNEIASRWQNWYKLYVQGAMGNPDVIPESMYNDPGMKLKGTPFAWWADNRVEKKINTVLDNFGLSSKDLPKELRGVDMQQLRHWSNLEAQYEMASLLAHPKSMVTNIFGGTMHTFQSVGYEPLKKARNILKAVGDYVYENLKSNNTIINKSQGGFYLMPEFINKDFSNSSEMCDDILKKTGVALLPGSVFGFDKETLVTFQPSCLILAAKW